MVTQYHICNYTYIYIYLSIVYIYKTDDKKFLRYG